jgi:hypothetical protein
MEKPIPTTPLPPELEYVSEIDGSTPLPGTVRSGMTSDASPALVVENVTGIVPTAAVSISDADGTAAGRTGCCGTQAITPRGGGGGLLYVQVQPPGRTPHATNITNGTRARKARRETKAQTPRNHGNNIEAPNLLGVQRPDAGATQRTRCIDPFQPTIVGGA